MKIKRTKPKEQRVGLAGRVSTTSLATQARAAWGEWLGCMTPWDHFVTLTFDRHTSATAAKRMFHCWVGRLQQRAQQRVEWFYSIERGADGNLVHLHALLAGTAIIGNAGCSSAWTYGIARAAEYDGGRGGSYYVTKTFDQEEADYDFRLDRNSRPHEATAVHGA